MQLDSDKHIDMRVGHAEARTFKRKKIVRDRKRFPWQRNEQPEELLNVYGIFPPNMKPSFKKD